VAYPDYSIVIITVTEGGATVNLAKAFYEKALARKYYNKAALDGFRAYYFERPMPSKFFGNSVLPFVQNVEKPLILQPVETPSLTQNSGTKTTVREAVNTAVSFVIDTAFNAVETVQTESFKTGEKVYDVYNNLFSKFRQFVGWEYNAFNSEALVLTVSNKRITLKHNGSGGVILPPTITKLWPNKDEVEMVDPEPVTTSIDGEVVTLGEKFVKKTWTGVQFAPPQLENTFVWVHAGFSLLRRDQIEYLSDGEGWYVQRDIPQYEGCDPVGYVYQQLTEAPIMYNLAEIYGIEQLVQLGTEYEEIVADGECGESQVTRQHYVATGQSVYEDEEFVYRKSTGLTVFRQPRITVEDINYQSECGPMKVGTRSFLYDGTGTDQYEYYSFGVEVGRCNGFIYFSVGQGEIYIEPEPEGEPPDPPTEDEDYCVGGETTAGDDDESFGKETGLPEIDGIYDENGVYVDATYDSYSQSWILN
jgi:hypothetical protein